MPGRRLLWFVGLYAGGVAAVGAAAGVAEAAGAGCWAAPARSMILSSSPRSSQTPRHLGQ